MSMLRCLFGVYVIALLVWYYPEQTMIWVPCGLCLTLMLA